MTSVQQVNVPLSETFARVSALDKDFRVDMGVLEPGWFLASELIDCESPLLEAGFEIARNQYPGADRRAQGSFFIGDYTWYLTSALAAAYLSARRAPALALDEVALRFGTYTWEYDGRTGEAPCLHIRFLTGRFAALPDDPAAQHTDALVLPDADALRAWMSAELEAHLTPLIDRILVQTRLGRRPQWNLTADSCARSFLHFGTLLGDPAFGQAQGRAFIKAAGSSMKPSTTDYLTLEAHGHSETYCARGGCCRYYTVPVANGNKCSTCVLRPIEERRQILLEYMTTRYAPAE